ncbi:deaminase, partial [Acinetobacter baumannii]|uniref:deaminase n=1 Tax=Acinetobacter baumannii TaxID=470 RepID=UPI0031F3F0C4
MTNDEAMGRALALAQQAAAEDDVPVGAVVLDAEGRVIGEGRNRREDNGDPLAHAEVLAMRQ